MATASCDCQHCLGEVSLQKELVIIDNQPFPLCTPTYSSSQNSVRFSPAGPASAVNNPQVQAVMCRSVFLLVLYTVNKTQQAHVNGFSALPIIILKIHNKVILMCSRKYGESGKYRNKNSCWTGNIQIKKKKKTSDS